MTFRFAMLGSGSKGNATLIEAGGTRVLVDCGFAVKDVQARAERLGFDLASLDAILVTHEHSDHLGGVAALSRAYKLPVLLTRGSYAGWKDRRVDDIRYITPHHGFQFGALWVQPIAVPHDAREPCQFSLSFGGRKVGVLSDLGTITPHIRKELSNCDALMLECNHDVEMLANGPYPHSLKVRVGGGYGHLSNGQAAGLAEALDRTRLQHLVLTHLSEKNNRPDLALDAIHTALQGAPEWCVCAEQEAGLSWREVV